MTDLANLADHGSQQSDRWLFIAVLIVLGLVVLFVARYFVRQHEGLLADHKQARADTRSFCWSWWKRATRRPRSWRCRWTATRGTLRISQRRRPSAKNNL